MIQHEYHGDRHPATEIERLTLSLTDALKALTDKTAECEALKDKLNRAQDEIETLSLDLGLVQK